ncbi:MAG: hypothetical protein R2834_10050 [Rhodothermales bacterium]
MRVRRVASAGDLKRFIDFQYTHYASNPHWVPQLRMDVKKTLDPRKNPFFEHGKIETFLAEDERGHVVGRIAAIVNGMHLKKYDDGNGFFGFFESIEDYHVAERLFETAGEWLRGQGLKGVRGPTNPSMNDISGLLVTGFDRSPSIMMPYNPPYYAEYLERYGFTRAMTMWAYYINMKYLSIDKLHRGVKLVYRRHPSLTLRKLDMAHFDRDAQIVLDIYNDAWSSNWGHVPMTKNEFAHLAKDLKQVVDPNIVFILEDAGRPVAFSISLPNINLALKHTNGRLLPFGLPQLLLRAKFGGIHECRTLLMGVIKEYQGMGLDAILNLEIMVEGPRNGYFASEMSWVLDSNPAMMNAITSYGGVMDKEYAMFERAL